MKKKILIITKNSFETQVEQVMDWIERLGHTCERLNGDVFEDSDINISINSRLKPNLSINGKLFSNNYYSIWFRRWSDNSLVNKIFELGIKNKLEFNLLNTLCSNITQNISTVEQVIIDTIKAKKKAYIL